MKVNSSSDIRPVTARKTDDPSSSSATGRTQAPPDTVSTAESARLVAAIAAVRSQAGAARAVQLQAIENAVRQGTFRPDPSRIAEKILQDAEITATLQAMMLK
jgi:negative regulator of flagellin synthesis FlgM